MDTSNFKEVFESPKVKELTAQLTALEADLEFQTNARIQDRKDAETNYKNWNAELKEQLAAAQEECEFQRNAHKQAEELMLEQSNQLAAAQEQLAKAKVRLEASERLLNEAHNALLWYYEMHADSDISQLLEKLEKHLNPL